MNLGKSTFWPVEQNAKCRLYYQFVVDGHIYAKCGTTITNSPNCHILRYTDSASVLDVSHHNGSTIRATHLNCFKRVGKKLLQAQTIKVVMWPETLYQIADEEVKMTSQAPRASIIVFEKVTIFIFIYIIKHHYFNIKIKMNGIDHFYKFPLTWLTNSMPLSKSYMWCHKS